MLRKTYPKLRKPNSICIDDIDCKNKRCYKLHNERKRFNICKFDIFFVPYIEDGCHFEDCTHNHPKRNSFYIQKDKDFDDLVISVVNHLELDDDTSIIEDWKRLMRNLYGDDLDKLYQELYQELNTYCINVNQLSFQLKALQLDDPQSYIYYFQNILENIYINYHKFNTLLQSIMIRYYDKHKDEYLFLYNRLNENIQYISMYKENAKNILYQYYGININF